MKYNLMPAVDDVMRNNKLLETYEIRDYQDQVSGTSCDNDDELLDPPELETYGFQEVDAQELQRWALFGDSGPYYD